MNAGPIVEFSAPYDRTAKILSIVVFAVLVVVSAAIRNWFAMGISALTIIVTYAYSARGYRASRESVTVKRLAGDAIIPLAGLREARPATADDFTGCMRLFGSGGMFGYF